MQKILSLFRALMCWILTLLIAVFFIFSMLIGNKRKSWEFWTHAWSKLMLFVLGIKVKVRGTENIKGPAIFVMNHQSILDIFILPSLAPANSTFIAKKEVSRIPLVSYVMRSCYSIFVDRKNTDSAIASIKKGLTTLPKGYSLIMFPEGTRSKDFKLRPLKKGVFHIAKQGAFSIIPLGCYGIEKLGLGGNNILYQPGTIYVHVNKKIETIHWKKENLENHLEEISNSIKEATNLAKEFSLSQK